MTTLLMLTTIFISVMQDLPKTAYIKHIDIWLVICQLFPFAQIFLLTAMETLREGNGSGEKVETKEVTEKAVQVVDKEGKVEVEIQLEEVDEEGNVVEEMEMNHDYKWLIQKSIWFYEAQRSGNLTENNRVPWRDDSLWFDKGMTSLSIIQYDSYCF